jgi:hypothetical protein
MGAGTESMRTSALARGVFAISLFILASPNAQAANPLDDLIEPADGKSARFTRVYDAEHLRHHPKQKTVSITVWLSYEAAGGNVSGVVLHDALAIVQRGDLAALYSEGGCDFDAKANRDTGNRLIKTYPKEGGHVCLHSAQPDVFFAVSAQEGGFMIMDRGKDPDTLMLYLDDSLLMVKRANRGKHIDIKFGADDRVFMLRRADKKACAAIEEAVSTPEPGARRRRTRAGEP